MACEALRELFAPELKEARQEGLKEGLKEGVREGVKDLILNALKTGSTALDISKVMGIPLEEVEAIEKSALELV